MLAVGEHMLGQVEEQSQRMATGFSGGIGITYRDVCGALTGGIMVIGALTGRTRPDEEETACLELATAYRNHFAVQFGSVVCHELRAEKYGSHAQEPCSVLVERAAIILLNLL